MKAENIFKKLLCIAGCAAVFSAVSVGTSYADNTATATATGKVILPIAVSKSTDLNFGNFAAGATGGTVDLTAVASTTRSKTGSVTLASGVTPTSAVFHVTGETGASFALTMDPLSLSGTGDPMVVTLESSLGAGSGTLTGGAADVVVAGSLAVGASQASGTYTGTLSVTVNYN